MKTLSMTHHDPSDSYFAFITGIIAQVIGMITFEGIIWPLLMAFCGGFLGMLGKKAAESVWPRVAAKIKAKLKTRSNRRQKS